MTGAFHVATEVAFVTLDDGEVTRLEHGDPLPENVHPDEVARLARGGVLEELDQASGFDPETSDEPVVVDQRLLAGNIDRVMVMIGHDADAAEAYLAAELAADKPRPTLITRLEEVIAEHGETDTVASDDADGDTVEGD